MRGSTVAKLHEKLPIGIGSFSYAHVSEIWKSERSGEQISELVEFYFLLVAG